MLTQVARSIYLSVRIIGGVAWTLTSLPWHRMQAERCFRRALRKSGLSRREAAMLTRLYRERSLKLRHALVLVRGIASRSI